MIYFCLNAHKIVVGTSSLLCMHTHTLYKPDFKQINCNTQIAWYYYFDCMGVYFFIYFSLNIIGFVIFRSRCITAIVPESSVFATLNGSEYGEKGVSILVHQLIKVTENCITVLCCPRVRFLRTFGTFWSDTYNHSICALLNVQLLVSYLFVVLLGGFIVSAL